MRPLGIQTLLFSCVILLLHDRQQCVAQRLRLNQIQTIGTHNSYRLPLPSEVSTLLRLTSPSSAQALDYSHRPLDEQLAELKVRQVELDLYADPAGGLFSKPVAFEADAAKRDRGELDPNAGGVLDQPGLKVLHSPDYDYRTTVPTFVAALRLIRQWSRANPMHVPILILVELKSDVVGPSNIRPIVFDEVELNKVDAEIRSVFDDDEMITPDQVRADCDTLREAILANGWPPLERCRGRVWFALDNEDVVRDRYLEGRPVLEGRAMFASLGMDNPASAFLKLNDPIEQFDQIQAAVRGGFIVRTRADAETREARANNTARRIAAFSSGAQYISTDYPVADVRLSDYSVALPDHVEYITNPISYVVAELAK